MKYSLSLGALLLSLAVVGCGGSSKGSSAPRRTNASIRVTWPARNRQIPLAANSLHITLYYKNQAVGEQTVARPAEPETQSLVEFTNVPVGDLGVTVKAFSNADGTGSLLSTGAGTLSTTAQTSGDLGVSLVSTATRLKFTPLLFRLGKGETKTIRVSAFDDDGNLVLLSANGVEEAVTWTSSAPGVAKVTGMGTAATVEGLTAGETTLRATFVTDDAGTQIEARSNLTIVPGSGTVTVQ